MTEPSDLDYNLVKGVCEDGGDLRAPSLIPFNSAVDADVDVTCLKALNSSRTGERRWDELPLVPLSLLFTPPRPIHG